MWTVGRRGPCGDYRCIRSVTAGGPRARPGMPYP